MAFMQITLLGDPFTDYLLTDVGAAAYELGHDWWTREDLQITTAPAGGGIPLVEGVDYLVAEPAPSEPGIKDLHARVTEAMGAGRTVYHKVQIINAVYQVGDLYHSGKYIADSNSALDMMELFYGRKELGELFFLDNYKAPAQFTAKTPGTFFAGLCLTVDDAVISETNWPELVPYLRAKKLIYNEGQGTAQSDYGVTTWAVAANVGTLTFANLVPEKAALAALLEDELVHGSYVNWRTITLPADIGNIPAGDYAITEVNAAARTVKFAVVAANGGAGVAAIASFYPRRIVGSTTTARVFKARGRAIVSAGDSDGECIAGLRRRDRMFGHWHTGQLEDGKQLALDAATGTAGAAWWKPGGLNSGDGNDLKFAIKDAITDGVNGTPCTGKSTDPRALVGHLYIWGRRYIA